MARGREEGSRIPQSQISPPSPYEMQSPSQSQEILLVFHVPASVLIWRVRDTGMSVCGWIPLGKRDRESRRGNRFVSSNVGQPSASLGT